MEIGLYQEDHAMQDENIAVQKIREISYRFPNSQDRLDDHGSRTG